MESFVYWLIPALVGVGCHSYVSERLRMWLCIMYHLWQCSVSVCPELWSDVSTFTSGSPRRAYAVRT